LLTDREKRAIVCLLGQPLVTWAIANNRDGVYGVRIGKLKTKIEIVLTPSPEKDGYFDIKISHSIKTPLQPRPWRQKWRRGSSRVDALHRSLFYLINHYRKAVAQGFEPGEDWLIAEHDLPERKRRRILKRHTAIPRGYGRSDECQRSTVERG